MAKKDYKKDCFAYDDYDKKCILLTDKAQRKGCAECVFYKTMERAIGDHKKSAELLNRLRKDDRRYFIRKYYPNGLWEDISKLYGKKA